MDSLFERWVATGDAKQDALEPFDRERYNQACLARIALVHEGFAVNSLLPRGPEA